MIRTLVALVCLLLASPLGAQVSPTVVVKSPKQVAPTTVVRVFLPHIGFVLIPVQLP